MRSLVSAAVVILGIARTAIAQPQIAYIIPDIGAAGMNTYVEIIAPTGATGTFGGTGLFVNANNGTETIGIGPANAADTSRIVVGPIVSSWGSRLLSTQIFVKPGAANGVVPLRVSVGGQSTTVNFEIVTPQVLGTGGVVNGGGVLGSGGSLGRRSARGAMIVENLILGTGNYTVSTTDPDNTTAGNQGYLPFILISRGNLAILSGATLSANAAGVAGGPGGGGAGGLVCDATFLNPNPGNGIAGGDGYSGGGGGGRNGSGGPSSITQNPGVGSGNNGASLSGATRGTNSWECSNPEGAGGGTGHPFGTGGGGSCNQSSSAGGNGGGGANGQNSGGGAGGYGTAGGNMAPSTTNGGKVHGNAMGVPVAGGSGGGSGNPQTVTGGCGAAGGGGGGALVLYSQTILNSTAAGVSANGANHSGASPSGGGGAGGYISLGAKVPSAFGGGGATSGGTGGATGGRGRSRYDGFVGNAPTFTNSATTYVGPTIDTLSYRQGSTFTLQGTFDGTNTPTIYMRSLAGVFAAMPAPATTGRVWSLQVTVPSSGLYYFVALQPVPGANPNDPAVAQPTHVMSQAGANIVRVDLIPKIGIDSATVTYSNPVCRSDTTIDAVKVYSTGDTTLRVTPTLGGANPGDFRILDPGPHNILPGDSVTIRVSFRAGAPGGRTATLILTNTDPRPGRNPTLVTLVGFGNNITRSLDRTSIDFGTICRDSTAVVEITLQRDGEVAGSVTSVVRRATGPQVFTVVMWGPLPLPFPAGPGTHRIQVRFRPTGPGPFADSFQVVVTPCNDTLRFTVRGTGVVTAISLSPDPLDFGNVRLTTTGTAQATVTNNGSASTMITEAFITPGGSPYAITSNPVGQTVGAGSALPIDLSFAPTAQGVAPARLCVVSGGSSCPDTACVDLTGRGTTSLIIISRRALVLSADSCDDAPGPLTDTFQVYNRGTAPVRIVSAVSGGTVGLSTTPSLPTDLAPGDSVTVRLTWTPGASGTDRITITTDASDPSQQTLTVDVTLRRERVGYQVVDGSGGPLPTILDVGNVFACAAPPIVEIEIRNTGTIPDTLSAAFVGGAPFALTPVGPYALGPGGSRRVRVSLPATASGTFADTLLLRDLCGRELRQPVVGGSYALSFALTGFDFGSSNVGVTRTGTVILQNTSGTPNNVKVVVASVTITPAAGSPYTVSRSDLPDTLAPNEATTVDVDFTPPSETPFGRQICFQITEPCDTLLCTTLNGRGIQSSVLVRRTSLDFGTLFLCQESLLDLSVLNTGTAPLNLQGLAITGGDAGLFEESPATSTPQTINPGDSIVLHVRFVPGRSTSDGPKTALLEITTDDPAQPTIRVTLIGERRRQFLATPVQLDFGRIDVGTTKEDTVTLENRTGAPLTVTGLLIPAPYTVVGTIPPQTFPAVIAQGDSIRVRVRYSPSDTARADGELLAIQTLPCEDTTRVAVTGRARIPQQGTATIAIAADLTGAPGNRVAVPILLNQGRLINESEATTFHVTLRFRATMLVPIRVRVKGEGFGKIVAGRIVSTTIDGADRVMTVEIAQSPVPTAPDTLGFIDMVVALGDRRQTPIVIDTVVWIDGDVTTSTVDGQFTVDSLCTVSNDRLVRGDAVFGLKQAVPNPFNPSSDLLFEISDEGETSLAIYDLHGRLVASLIDREHLSPGPQIRTWTAADQPSGIYLAVLTSPTERSVMHLIVVK